MQQIYARKQPECPVVLAPPWSERLFSTHNITAVNLLAVDWPTLRLAMVPSCPGSASAASPHVTLVPNTCDSGRRKFVQQFRYELVTRKDKCAWLKWPVSVVQGFSRGSGIYLGTMHPSRMGLQYMPSVHGTVRASILVRHQYHQPEVHEPHAQCARRTAIHMHSLAPRHSTPHMRLANSSYHIVSILSQNHPFPPPFPRQLCWRGGGVLTNCRDTHQSLSPLGPQSDLECVSDRQRLVLSLT
jgi:hypothetical protein